MKADGRACLRDQYTTTATIERVIDGDTVLLEDGRKVRIIGVNTLEINARHELDQYWAKAATTAVQKLADKQRVTMTHEADSLDRHGRVLAHIQTPDGIDVGRYLIEQGLALAIAVGRNTLCAENNSMVEQNARAQGVGIWKQAGNWLLIEDELRSKKRGFHVVRDQVDAIQVRGKHNRLFLKNGLIVKIAATLTAKNDADRNWLESLQGKTVEVRGWLSGKAGKAELTLYHPSSLSLLPD